MIARGLFAFVVSTVLFCMMETPAVLYVLILEAFLFMVFISFDWRKNRDFYHNLSAGVAANIISFSLVWWSRGKQENWQEVLIAGGVFLGACVLIYAFIYVFRKDKASSTDHEKCSSSTEKLFEEHKDDLARMKGLLSRDDVNILGINSAWGNGKTFVVNRLCSDMADEYHVIKIETLTYRYNEFDRVLIDKLDELLRGNGIFSFYALAFKQTLGNSFWGRLAYHYFYGIRSGNASVFDGLKKELKRLPKKVLIVFEDLERIGNEEAVKRLLSIAERLAGNRVKIVYEYDRLQLQKSTSLNREYLEKYIPSEMNLTDISYSSLVKAVWETKRLDNDPAVNRKILLGSDGFMGGKTLKEMVFQFVEWQYDSFGNRFEYGKINFGRNRLTVRRIECFLDEILSWTRNHDERKIDGQTARVVVAFSFLKHFEDELYEKLEPWKPLEDLFLFQYKNEIIGIEKLGQSIWAELGENGSQDAKIFRRRLQDCVRAEENADSFRVFALFRYRFDDLEAWLRVGGDVRKASPQDAEKLRRAGESREKTNRLIWNLLQSGKSEYTDSRACVDKFIYDVLNKPEDTWDEAFERYWSDVYNNNIHKDNQTIYRFGEPPLLTLVREATFHVHGADFWGQMCEFIRRKWSGKSITREFVELCFWAEIDSVKNMSKLVQIFNSLDVECNFNDQEYYWEFLRKYIGQLSRWGYCSDMVWGLFRKGRPDFDTSEWKPIVCECLKKEQESMARSRLLDIKEYLETVETFAAFIGKNIEIIENPKASMSRLPKVQIKEHVEYVHQGKMDDLRNELNEPYSADREEEVQRELEEAFRNDDLYPCEIKIVKGWMEQ